MKKIILLTLLLVVLAVPAAPAGAMTMSGLGGLITGGTVSVPGGYTYEKAIALNTTVTGANVSGSVSNFPVAVHINANSWTVSGARTHFFNDTYNPAGKRIRFWAADGTTALSYDVVSYSTGSQDAIYYVKVPTVTGNATTTIYVTYGNDPYGTDQDNATAVWDSNFKTVQHLGNNSWGTAPEAKDSTSNAYNATNTSSTDAAGIVGQGRAFAGSGKIVYASTTAGYTQGAKTWEIWSSFTTTAAVAFVDTSLAGSSNNGASLFTYLGKPNWHHAHAVAGEPNFRVDSGSVTVNNGSMHYIAGTWDGTTGSGKAHLYVDGVDVTTDTYGMESVDGTENVNPTYPITLGAMANTTQAFTGTLDEFRASSVARSADWIKLSYFSAKKTSYNGDAWVTFGSELW